VNDVGIRIKDVVVRDLGLERIGSDDLRGDRVATEILRLVPADILTRIGRDVICRRREKLRLESECRTSEHHAQHDNKTKLLHELLLLH
jgi:hypothetical protein